MPLQEDQKSSTPLKSVTIKTLFLAASNRKRKASSPIPPPTEAKNVRICDKESDDDVQVLDASLNSDASASDCKENQDVNTLQSEQVPPLNGATVLSDNDLKSIESGEHMSGEDESSKASSDDLNSSQLNSSVNALNTSGLSEANQGTAEKNVLANTGEAISEPKPGDANEQEKKTNTKKRKRMTPEEAKQKAEEREKKQQERLLKKQELEAKKQELEAKKLERERELKDRKLQKEMEKKAKEEERKEKERLRLEKKEQEEKEKQLKLEERETQKRMRQSILEAKLEKKKQMEEMKLKQAEEKKKADLEKEQKEKEKQEKAKAAFVKFFDKENTSPPPTQKSVEQDSVFKPFQISEDMTLAPVIPTVSQQRFNRETLDSAVTSQSDTHLYLEILKSGSYQDVRHRKKQRKPKLCDTDVIVVETDRIGLNLTAKLIQFSENVRPPYWGTWRKKSRAIRPRNPFGQDEIFDYEVDSDDEWDEGGPGESLSGTEQEDESGDDENDNYEENEFFVPHGYLSAEEEKEDDDETEVDNDPENRKKLLTKKLQEFEIERKKKTTELKPIILGCYIENNLSATENSHLLVALESYSAVLLIDTPIPTSFTVKSIQNESKPNSNVSSPTSASNTAKSKKACVPDEAMPHLIRLVHGNHHNLAFLIEEFKKFWQQHCLSQEQTEKLISEKPATKVEGSNSTAVLDSPSTDSVISKRQLTITLKQIATKRSVDNVKKPVWYVNEEVREKHGLVDLTITNAWTYLTKDIKENVEASPITKLANSKFSIKEFLA